MFGRLIELLAGGWDYIAPFVVVDAYEYAVILRFGRYHRTNEPGFCWKIPLAERAIGVNSCTTTLRLAPQSLTTKDEAAVVVSAIVKYKIADPRPYVIEVWDQIDVLADVTMGAIARQVRLLNATELFSDPPEKPVAAAVRRQVARYGFEVEAVTFTDAARAKSLRLVAPHGKDLAN